MSYWLAGRRSPSAVLVRLERAESKPRPLRTLFINTSLPVGGAETLLVNLIDRLDRERIDPEIVCLKTPGELGESLLDRHRVHSGLTSGKWDLSVLPKLIRLMRDREVDAVVTIGAGDKMFWGRLAAKLAGVPVVCSALHSTGWPDGVGRLNRMLTPLTDAFIAVADHHAAHMVEHERFPVDRVHTIRNGIDCERFTPSTAAKSWITGELSLPTDTKLVGIVAALRPEKNHAMFIDVASRIISSDPDVHFLIVGDGPERTMIEELIRRRGIIENVHLLGTRHDTPRIVAALDVFLLCSHNEASPVSILEALACGVPVISTRVGSVAETVIDGQTGFLVSPGDVDEMVGHLEKLLSDRGSNERLGARGREVVMATGSLDSMVKGYTELIETLHRRKQMAVSGENYPVGHREQALPRLSALRGAMHGCEQPIDA